ncbi:MAG: DHA2 family efflux MFS transporter permease subunit [Terriglobales bacterium]
MWTRWLIAIAVMASAVMELVDTSAVNVSIPYIAGNLSASVDEATWVLTSYLVSNAIMLPLTGWISARIGRKRLLLTAVGGFTCASILCGFAPTLPALIACRVLQGAFGGVLQPITRAILLESFPREERGHAMAMWGVGIVVAPIVAPLLGGWLTTDYSWRWVFFINIPVSVFAWFMVKVFVFDPAYLKRVKEGADTWGILLLAFGIASLQMVLDKGQEADWFSSHLIVIAAVVAVICLVAFVLWELHTDHPVVHLRLLKYRTFGTACALSLILFFVLYGSILLLPLFMQEVLHFPAVTAGLWNMPRGLATMIGMPVVGILIGKRWDMRGMLFCGLISSAIGVLMFSQLNGQSGPWAFWWPQIVMGLGLSLVFVPFATISVDPIPNPEMGYATSITGLTRNLGSSFGISIMATALARGGQTNHARLVKHLNPSNPLVSALHSSIAQGLLHEGSSLAQASVQAWGVLQGEIMRQATVLSYLDAFRSLAIVFFLAAPLVWLMRQPKFDKH